MRNVLAAGVTVAPDLGLIAWSVYVLAVTVAALVTVAKARWGWALVGVLTGGLGMLGGATRPAAPDSFWAKTAARRRQPKVSAGARRDRR